MLLSLVDVFRCPAEHEDSALVLSVDAWERGRIREGTLGCPMCHARYSISGAVVDFRTGPSPPPPVDHPESVTEGEVLRLRAQLNLAEPGGIILLQGRYARLANQLLEQLDLTCLIMDATANHPQSVQICVDRRVPIAAGALRAVAIDEHATLSMADLVRAIRGGGRLLGSGRGTPSGNVRIIAHDQQEWVGEVQGPLPLVSLRRTATGSGAPPI